MAEGLVLRQKSMQTSSRSELCCNCAKIPFSASPDAIHNFGDHRWLGELGDVQKNSNCPVCRLMIRAFLRSKQINRHKYSPTHNVWIMRAYSGLGWNIRNGVYHIGFPKWTCDIVYLRSFQKSRSPAELAPGAFVPLRNELSTVRVRDWLTTCTEAHPLCHRETKRLSLPFPQEYSSGEAGLLRLIDVIENCIVESHEFCRYIALSYVWGKVKDFRLTTSNRDYLMAGGSLIKLWNLIPATIANAIVLVRKLGERYLWVDSMCLVQDDPQDLAYGINIMDLIYEQAVMTIVAASGHDANSGLPGVVGSRRSRRRDVEEILLGMYLGIDYQLDGMLSKSVYRTRGWTLQEEMLSRRCLYFAGRQAFLRCSTLTFSETSADHVGQQMSHSLNDSGNSGNSSKELDPRPGYKSAYIGTEEHSAFENDPQNTSGSNDELASSPPPRLFATSAEGYRLMLEVFSKRNLRRDEDTLFALTGIVRKYEVSMKTSFIQGLPRSLLGYFLLFRHNGRGPRRCKAFASYSWAGWKGQIKFIFPNPRPWAVERFTLTDPDTTLNCELDQDKSINSDADGRFSYPLLRFSAYVVRFKLTHIDDDKATAAMITRYGDSIGILYMDGNREDSFFNYKDTYEFALMNPYDAFHTDWQNGSDNSWMILIEEINGVVERRGIANLDDGFAGGIQDAFPPGPILKEIIMA